MKIKVINSSPLLSAGIHQVSIDKVYTEQAKTGSEQLAVIFKSEDGRKFTNWYNLQGFKRDPKEPTIVDENGYSRPNYLTDKQGNRVQDDEATNQCLSIIGKLMFHAGLDADTDQDPEKSLEGKSVTLAIRSENKGYGQRDVVHYTAFPQEAGAVESVL